MTRLLYIQASPREGRSHSVAVADAFVAAWKQANPEGEVVVKNLFDADLPPLDGLTIQGRYNLMHGKDHSPEEKRAWERVEQVIAEFTSFDRYVFAVPMWNFSIPYRLKHYIDLLAHPGYTFTVGEAGYEGLLKGKKAFLALASGGEYGPECPTDSHDFQTGYLHWILGFMGIHDVLESDPRGTLMPSREENKSAALARAREQAASF